MEMTSERIKALMEILRTSDHRGAADLHDAFAAEFGWSHHDANTPITIINEDDCND